jgi:hypothetical protein
VEAMSRKTDNIENLQDYARLKLEASKSALLNSLMSKRFDCKMMGKELYYGNQEATAMVVARVVLEETEVVFQLVTGMPQTGKTGCMIAIVEMTMTMAGCDTKINPDNIFVITGLSSTDWREQTKERMPNTLLPNVYHRGEMKKLKAKLRGLSDVLILIDEVHIASKENMTIDGMLREIGVKDITVLREKNINIIQFSATPNRILDDLKLWGAMARHVVMQPGAGYRGVNELLSSGRVYDAKDLFISDDPTASMSPTDRERRHTAIKPAKDAIRELKERIGSCYIEPKYHIIRLPTGAKFDTVRGRFLAEFGNTGFEHVTCTSTSDETEVQSLIEHPPAKHTIVYIKEHLRCAVTLSPKKNLGILYDRPSKNDDVMVQGLAGRTFGYEACDDVIVYTSIDSLKNYQKVWETGFGDLSAMTYQGSRSRKNKKTLIHPATFAGHSVVIAENQQHPVIDQGSYRVYTTYSEVQEAARKMGYDARGVKPPKAMEDGFVWTSLNAKRCIAGLSEAISKVPTAYGTNKGKTTWRTYYPCYEDTHDASTLRFVFIIRPKADGSRHTNEELESIGV